MRRTERLFQIIQILRANRAPVTGRALADELEISLRTLYRDMAELIAQRVPVTGEAGMGYVLDDGYDMPPLMLTADELEAAALGAAWVVANGDPSLAIAARDLVTKLSQAIPKELRPIVLDAGVKSVPGRTRIRDPFESTTLRRAIREGLKLKITYGDEQGRLSNRIIWPLFVAYFDHVRLIVGWCELRQDFRHFRNDRLQSVALVDEKYPGRRLALIKEWERNRQDGR